MSYSSPLSRQGSIMISFHFLYDDAKGGLDKHLFSFRIGYPTDLQNLPAVVDQASLRIISCLEDNLIAETF